MTFVPPTTLSVRKSIFLQLRDAITRHGDQVILASVFFALFCVTCLPNFLGATLNLFAVENDLTHSRTISSAELLGFIAIAVVLADLKTDRVLRSLDLVAAIGIAAASLYPSPTIRAIGMTCLGLFFIAHTDRRIGSLGQLCLGLVWIDFWGALVLDAIKPWLLPMEAHLAFAPLQLTGSFSIDGQVITSGNGFAIEVAEPCSAFHNTVTTAFMWLSLMKIQKLEFNLRHACYLAAALTAVVVLNSARIAIMAVSESQYLFWHEGPGLWIIKAVMLGTLFGVFCFDLWTSRAPNATKLKTA